jgi:hypothetical protein
VDRRKSRPPVSQALVGKSKMKNRFYGDKKDYIKYGLLDILSSQYKSIGINWYLTDNRHGNQRHGKDTRYLDDENWRYYDPRIFLLLKYRVNNNQRDVRYCRMDGVVEIKHEFIEGLPDHAEQRDYQKLREGWHVKAKDKLAKCDLVFFDPDIGVTEQLPVGPIRASEYSSIAEISDYEWCDWLVIQFLQPRRRFDQLCANPITITAKSINKKVIVFISFSLAFLYVTDKVDILLLRQIFERWDTKISPQILIA